MQRSSLVQIRPGPWAFKPLLYFSGAFAAPFPIANDRDMAGVESILIDEKEIAVEDTIKLLESWIKRLENIERKLRGRI